MYGYGHEIFGWGHPFALIGWALLWVAVIVGIVALVRYAFRDRHPAGQPDRKSPGTGSPGWGADAERLLAERFARGEISEDEYRRDLATLRAS